MSPAIYFVPSAGLALAILPLPYAFYITLRFIVCGAACLILFVDYNDTKGGRSTDYLQKIALTQFERIAFVCMAILFNPILPVYLYDKALWLIPNIAGAILFAQHGFRVASSGKS